MHRALIATAGTVASLVALLGYKSSGSLLTTSHVAVTLPSAPGAALPRSGTPSTGSAGTKPPKHAKVSVHARTIPASHNGTTPTSPTSSPSPSGSSITSAFAPTTPATSPPAMAPPTTGPPTTAPPTTAPPTTVPPTTTTTQPTNSSYTGSLIQYIYGQLQLQVSMSGTKIDSVSVAQESAPDPRSAYINSQAIPILTQEALSAQGVNIDVVSGATFTSQAFAQALQSALTQAGR